jgi:regulator of replication initiation timing
VWSNRKLRHLRDQVKAKDQQIRQFENQVSKLLQQNGQLQADNDQIRGYIKAFLQSKRDKGYIIECFKRVVGVQ